MTEPTKEQMMAALIEITELIEESEGLIGFHGKRMPTTWKELRDNHFLLNYDKAMNNARHNSETDH